MSYNQTRVIREHLDTLDHRPKGADDSRYAGKLGIDHRLSVQSNQLSTK
jgi:hypothetical protein